MIWLLVLTVIILGYFAFSIYRHDDTAFGKETGYTYFDVLLTSRVRRLNKIYKTLDRTDGLHRIVVDVAVPTGESTRKVDALFIHESGIYVMNIKKMGGWINGHEEDLQWTQLLHGDEQKPFENPVHDVKRDIYALQEHLPEMNRDAYETIVLFTDDCAFQKIELTSQNVDVVKMKQLKAWTKTLAGQVLSETEMDTVYSVVQSMAQKKPVKLAKKKPVAIS
ncbi:MAG: nuclease-related domain-containing protein [Solibacillus sp.]